MQDFLRYLNKRGNGKVTDGLAHLARSGLNRLLQFTAQCSGAASFGHKRVVTHLGGRRFDSRHDFRQLLAAEAWTDAIASKSKSVSMSSKHFRLSRKDPH